jgi:HK97 family phage prohead protease
MERKELMLPLTDVCLKASGEGYTFEGYASKFNGVDSYGDTILPGAYKNALKDLKVSGRMPKMFFNHKAWELPVGKWTKASEDDEGLYVAGSLTKGMRLSEDLRLALADNTLDGLSVGIGMKSEDYEWVEDSKSKISRIIKKVCCGRCRWSPSRLMTRVASTPVPSRRSWTTCRPSKIWSASCARQEASAKRLRRWWSAVRRRSSGVSP